MRSIDRRLMLTTTIGGAAALAITPALGQTPVTAPVTAPANTDWPTYGADLNSTRYMPLDQVNESNFNKLEVAWTFRTENLGGRPEYILQCTPLLIKGRLYATAGSRRNVVCLDAGTGELLWMHRMDEGRRATNAPRQLSGRGVSYWTDGTNERILYVTIGYRMVSLDARTGLVDESFGDKGIVDLKTQIDQDLDPETADIGLHTAPLIVNDTIVIGAAHTAGNTPKIIRNARGYVRGFDVKTGKRKWIFHTIPHKGEFGYDTWAPGTAEMAGNTGAWAQMSADPELGLVYFGVEMPTGDQMGFYRPGNNLFAESIVAVDIETGLRKWHYQMIHHGLWDYDVPCAPILCDIPHNGRIVKAIAQPTKQSFIYVLDRATGKPVWPIPEKKVIPGDVPGEWYSPTQPIPSKPPAFDKQGITKDDLIDWTPELRKKAEAVASKYVMAPIYTAPIMPKKGGPYGVLNLPGYIGGINWPGASYDPENHTVYTYSQTNLLTLGVIIPNPDKKMGEFDYVHVNPPADSPDFQPGNTSVDGLPLIKPPYGRITATNLAKGTQDWQVAHGETPDAIRNHPALKGITIPRTGMIGKVGPLATKSLVICGDPDTYTDEQGRLAARLRAYSKTDGREVGAVFIPAPQSGSPMTYMHNGKQHILLAVGGRGQKAQFMAFRLP
ncbi:MAG TPA: PQQ-binding-like beta-propeller repeat protein [Rhizomicrobium sp.]|nr:PQQ-binding-like beta-propeller repeat protein [Rhizomicrobium sp.]